MYRIAQMVAYGVLLIGLAGCPDRGDINGDGLRDSVRLKDGVGVNIRYRIAHNGEKILSEKRLIPVTGATKFSVDYVNDDDRLDLIITAKPSRGPPTLTDYVVYQNEDGTFKPAVPKD